MPNADSIDILWKNIRVLVTDDESEMREIFATWLRNLGCEVVEASDGLEALEKAKQSTFDIIVTDVRMPRLDGVQLAKKLGESVAYTPVIIFVSGFHDFPAIEAHDLGIEAVLSKPCARKQLIHSVRASLLRRQLQFLAEEQASAPLVALMEKSFPHSAEVSQVAIGRGGFSFSWGSRLEQENIVGYRLKFAAGVLRLLEGTGIVRWAEIHQGTQRVGVEFISLAEQSRQEVLALLNEVRPHSFIPKDCRVAHPAPSGL